MAYSITDEYANLLDRRKELELKLSLLPTGYISHKTIKGKPYAYLQNRRDGKFTSKYLKADDVDRVSEQLCQRKQYEGELPAINRRMEVLEQAAALIGNHLTCELMRLKISSGMDNLEKDQKERCSSFAGAMNAIEGVQVSRQTQQDISKWQEGEQTFHSVLEATLLRYGFPVEV